jgi:hypothetical protein
MPKGQIQRMMPIGQVPKQATNTKPIPHIPLPFEEVMKDVLRAKPPEKAHPEPQRRKSQSLRQIKGDL